VNDWLLSIKSGLLSLIVFCWFSVFPFCWPARPVFGDFAINDVIRGLHASDHAKDEGKASII